MKETTITIETKSLLVLCSRISRGAKCPVCGSEGEMISLEAGSPAVADIPVLGQWLKSGEVHQSEAVDGSALICLSSLLVYVQNANLANCGIPRLPKTEKEGI